MQYMVYEKNEFFLVLKLVGVHDPFYRYWDLWTEKQFFGFKLIACAFPQPFIMDKPPKGKFYATSTLSVEIYMDLFIV